MAVKTYLGEPPAHIKQWIIDHYSMQIPDIYSITDMVQFSQIDLQSDNTIVLDQDDSVKGNIIYKTVIDGITNS